MATKKGSNATDGWKLLKSGALNNGIWYASQYAAGWYFVAVNHNTLGPFKSFEEGEKVWAKQGLLLGETTKRKQ